MSIDAIDRTAMGDLRREAMFLVERLREFENENLTDDTASNWFGHVAPSISRVAALAQSAGQGQGRGEPVSGIPVNDGLANIMEALWHDAEAECDKLALGVWPSDEAIAEAFHEHRRMSETRLPPWSDVSEGSGIWRHSHDFVCRLRSLPVAAAPPPPAGTAGAEGAGDLASGFAAYTPIKAQSATEILPPPSRLVPGREEIARLAFIEIFLSNATSPEDDWDAASIAWNKGRYEDDRTVAFAIADAVLASLPACQGDGTRAAERPMPYRSGQLVEAAPAAPRPSEEEIAGIIAEYTVNWVPIEDHPLFLDAVSELARRLALLTPADRGERRAAEPLPARVIRFLIASTAMADREEDEDLVALRDWGRARYEVLKRELGSFEAARRQSLTEAVAALMSAYPAIPARPAPAQGGGE